VPECDGSADVGPSAAAGGGGGDLGIWSTHCVGHLTHISSCQLPAV